MTAREAAQLILAVAGMQQAQQSSSVVNAYWRLKPTETRGVGGQVLSNIKRADGVDAPGDLQPELKPLYTQPMAADEPTQRAAKSRVSSAARTKLNQRAMWQKCEAIMATNFDRHDLWVTLTYRDADLPHSREQAVRCLAWFIDELRRVRRA